MAARQAVVAVIGNPNTGKSSLFNLLTGMHQKVANYPGVTVEKRTGELQVDGQDILLVDLPGTYSLSAHSPDERVAVDVLLGRVPDVPKPDAVMVVVDASNLRRNLFLATQLRELGVPLVVALNMVDVASARGVDIDALRLSERLDAPVIPLTATAKEVNTRPLLQALASAVRGSAPETLSAPSVLLPDVRDAAIELAERWSRLSGTRVEAYLVERALIDKGGESEYALAQALGSDVADELESRRTGLRADYQTLAEREARSRYAHVGKLMEGAVRIPLQPAATASDRVDRFLSHPIIGSLCFVLVMGAVFQAVFAWATPLMDWIDALAGAASGVVYATLPEGALASLLADGVIAGVGSVVIFLPQILILFAFVIFLEDSGYMARAAFLVDRLMRWCGLSGHSFVPMLSGFACAVPAIMGTRVIPDRRDRIATLMAVPFMTCSARLPVYALLIAAFVPQRHYFFGLLNLHGLVLLGLYLLGIVGGVLTAYLLKRSFLRRAAPSFLMELPPYRLPNPRSVALRLMERARLFLVRAGTVIFFVAVVVWALAYFPRSDSFDSEWAAQVQQLEQVEVDPSQRQLELQALENAQAAAHLEQSYLGRLGKAIAPVFRPLGWDWKVSAAVVASFPAREVVVAVLGTIYAVGADVEAEDVSLRDRIRSATWPDGSAVFTVPMAVGLMVFYAFCLQCAATVATIARETNSWRWPLLAWGYMTGLGYAGAYVCVLVGQAFG